MSKQIKTRRTRNPKTKEQKGREQWNKDCAKINREIRRK